MSLITCFDVDTEDQALPFGPDDEVLPGVRFGRPDELLMPAYWAMRCVTADPSDYDFVSHQGTLEDEIVFCLLGGFGVSQEVASAFFEKLKSTGLLSRGQVASRRAIQEVLNSPTDVRGQSRRYRFPNQRAERIHLALTRLGELDLNVQDPLQFRRQIQSLAGIGPKTASWIARNWLNVDEVAILDVHIFRAGLFLGLFDESSRLPRDYLAMEDRFLTFADKICVRPSVLDGVMWSDMRVFGSNITRRAIRA